MSLHKTTAAWSLLLSGVLACHAGSALAQGERVGSSKPQPDLANVKYGPHERNVLDLWKAKSERPTPLMVFIHGGGFSAGSKEALPPALLDGCLKAGISVASVNYRLSPGVSFPAHYMDCARAIQFLRYRSKDWNLDPKRIAASGGSAGAGTSLWIGFHDDMADPKNPDPVLRESTRLSCMAVFGAQSTYDPRVIQKIVGGRAHEHPALAGFYGLKHDELDTPRAYKLYDEASPITHLSAGDPPVYAFYDEPRGPLPADAKPGQGIHHINFGAYLKERMDKLGVECIVRHRDEGADPNAEVIAFLVRHLKPWSPQAVQSDAKGTAAKPKVLRSGIVGWDAVAADQADWGEMRRYFTGETAGTQNVLAAVAVIQPGKAIHRAHRHAEEEYLVLVTGSGTWSLDGKEFPAKRGDILYAEPWVYHGLTNSGNEPLIFVVVRFSSKGVKPPPRPDNRPDEQ